MSASAPSPPIGLVIALLLEQRPIARRLGLREPLTGAIRGEWAGRPVVGRLSGVGRQRAAETARRLIVDDGCQALVSAGFGGGLAPDLTAGQTLLLARIATPEGESLAAEPAWCAAATGLTQATGLTVHQLCNEPERRLALHTATGAAVVDMETYSVAAVARELGVPWVGLRTITDTVERPLPEFIVRRLDPHSGEVRLFRLFAHLVPRPGCWVELFRLGQASGRAGRALAEGLARVLEVAP